ncbi:unnamed protein product [Adineta steineri]|uniref:Tetratricopeptide repeat protein n=1 Tax=Adineta steineri TaxID=433720 RepID=A0A814CBC6_9BILA|nr:unnamed protein product [Adineta steineri]CAF3668454.1 unnamed protein product [Adineta steineri]
MKKHLKVGKELFLQIILYWLGRTTTSVWCIPGWESTRKHFHTTKKTLKFIKKPFLSNHPLSATSYNNIGLVYYNTKDYSKALSYYERALNIKQRTLPPTHPSIKSVKESIEAVKKKL